MSAGDPPPSLTQETEIGGHHELVFVDGGIQDHQQLVDGFLAAVDGSRSIQVVVLDPSTDGIEQISETLARYRGLDAVHLLSHGDDGSLALGSATLDLRSLGTHREAIAGWADALDADADLLLYGCNLAAGEDGRALTAELAQLTRADIAASDDLTGAALLGGDWDLEHEVGDIDTPLALKTPMASSFSAVLASVSDGTISNEQKISDTSGGLTATLDDGDAFGAAVAGIGDLDGDGINDIAVGARYDDDGGTDRGAVHILFLNADGTVKAEQKISDTAGGLTATLDDNDKFGVGVTSIGDLDGDGVTDLAVGALFDDDGGTDRGAVYVLNLTKLNEAPILAALDANPTFIEDGTAVVLDGDVTVFDTELSAADSFDGATLGLQRNGAASAEDVFSAVGNLAALTESGNLTLSGVTIGTVTTNSGGTLVLTFDASSTQARVNETLQSIAYSNLSDAPPASVQIDWTFDDGNTGAQGSGGALQGLGTITVTIIASNDPPDITSDGGGSAAAVDVAESSTTVTTVAATDPEGSTPTYSISGGADQARFNINPTSGVLTFDAAPDFEFPGDADLDNVYEVEVTADDGSSGTDIQLLSVTVTNVSDTLSLWLSTDSNVGAPGANGLPGGWSEGEVLELSGPDAALGGASTDGELSVVIDFAAFTADAVDTGALHYVNRDTTVGSGANTFDLKVGDILVSFLQDETVLAPYTVSGSNELYEDNDLLVFRPATVGDYSDGTFHLLLDDVVGDDLKGVTLVERTTTIGGTVVEDGSFLLISESSATTSVDLFVPTGVGEGTTSGSMTPFIDLSTLGIDANRLRGIEVIEQDTTAGGQFLAAGTILATLNVDDDVSGLAVNALKVKQSDVFALQLSATGPGTTAGTAIMVMEGARIGLDGNPVAENPYALALFDPTPDGNAGPVITSASAHNVAENTISVTTVTATDGDADVLTYAISGGADGALFQIDPTTGILAFNAPEDFEIPLDAGNDRTYVVDVTVSDRHGGSQTQIITVNLLNVTPSASNDAFAVNANVTLDVGWWNSDWSHRQQLTFDNLAQTETLTEFPVLVVLDGTRIDYAKTNDDGSDLRFFAADGSPLAYEIEQWNEGGKSSVWVRIPQITGASSSDSIWMYYGNALAEPAADAAGVWDSNFAGVWHLDEEQPGTGISDVYVDSTGNANHGTDRVSATGQDGQVTDGQQLDASDWIEIDHDPVLDLKDSMTISFWIKPGSDSGTARLYLDGSEIATGSYTGGVVPGNAGRLAIGHDDPDFDFDAFVDEVQISSTDRSADWIAAQYQATRNQSGAEFVLFGTEQATPVTDGVMGNDVSDSYRTTVTNLDTTGTLGLVTVRSDGTFSYDPNGQFDSLAAGATADDSFTYTLTDGTETSAPATVTVTVNDQGGGGPQSVLAPTTVTITRVNDAPIAAAAPVLSVLEDAAPSAIDLHALFSDADDADGALIYSVRSVSDPDLVSAASITTADFLSASDVDHAAGELTYQLLSAPVAGTLELSGAALAHGDTFTQADLDAGRIQYRAAVAGGDDRFLVQLSDAGGASADAVQLTVAVGDVLRTPAPVDEDDADAGSDGESPGTQTQSQDGNGQPTPGGEASVASTAQALPMTRVSQVVTPQPLLADSEPGPAIAPVREPTPERRGTDSARRVTASPAPTHHLAQQESVPQPVPVAIASGFLGVEPPRAMDATTLANMQAGIARALEGMDQGDQVRQEDAALTLQAMGGVSLGLSAGYLVWLLRSGSLIAAFLSTMPLWRGMDPLLIVGTARDEDDRFREQSDAESVQKIFDPSDETAAPAEP